MRLSKFLFVMIRLYITLNASVSCAELALSSDAS